MLRHFVHSALVIAALSVAPNLISATPAHATTFAELTQQQRVDASVYVVEGRVTRVWTELDNNGMVWTRAAVEVDQVFKGKDDVREIIVDTAGGQADGVQVHVPGAASFSKDERVILFLDQVNDRYTPVQMFLGKFSIRMASDTKSLYAMRWLADEKEKFDARFLPHPPADRRVSYESLVQEIEAQVATGWNGQPIPGMSADALRVRNIR